MNEPRWVYTDTDGVERVLRAPDRHEAERRIVRAEIARGAPSIAAREIAARSVRLEVRA